MPGRFLKLFLSYPSEQQDLAERLRLALEAERHEVFTDRSELRAGEAYHEKLRAMIEASDAVVFLITPRAVAAGSYTLSELDVAQRRWRRPSGHVLPVMVLPTPIDSLPAYLRAVTLLQPRGDVVAETVAAVARLGGGPRWRRMVAAGLVAVVAAAAAAGLWQVRRQQAQQAQQLAQRADAARELCASGSHAAAWDALRLDADHHPDAGSVQHALEDCGMTWLRGMRATEGRTTFGEQVARIVPVLTRGLAAAPPARRAALRAHIGWADFLRSRDGVAAPDPTPQYRAALADDPASVYAHAMWAHWLMTARDADPEAARRHFALALRAGTDRAWVRQLQWGAAFWRGANKVYAIEVADDMRRAGEALSSEQRHRLWTDAIYVGMPDADDRAVWLAALPAADWQATFEWAFPRPADGDADLPLWRFAHAVLRLGGSGHATALAELKALEREPVAANRPSRLRTAIDAILRPQGAR